MSDPGYPIVASYRKVTKGRTVRYAPVIRYNSPIDPHTRTVGRRRFYSPEQARAEAQAQIERDRAFYGDE